MTTFLNDFGVVCALGNNKSEVKQALHHPELEYQSLDHELHLDGDPVYVGKVKGALPDMSAFPSYQRTRNNALALMAVQQLEPTLSPLLAKFDSQRIAVIIGTTTAGVRTAEEAVAHYMATDAFPVEYGHQCQELIAPAQFLAEYLGVNGPTYTISTACSSSTKVMTTAHMLLDTDMADVVLCGGVDSLCQLTVNGFEALDSTSQSLCEPFSESRDGINLGEAAAFFVMSKQPGPVALLGVGETSDAYHISAPDPSGDGAIRAINIALEMANRTPEDVDYINLHGTGTLKNDEMESRAVYTLFSDKVPCSSTKRLTGHTLGAAGALELGLCWLHLTDAETPLPPHKMTKPRDESLDPIQLVQSVTQQASRICLSNSFAFGGNNISVLIGQADAAKSL
ncbi:beta-ketoacyl-ACP synthase [Pseudoalteromonas luteoviolacea]|uniref:beta-ketoacyl-ACP synthase n=1 Tax=Pseudoalteromonas luteoviolacea TaxID=43657 RepID=UPI001EED1C38|nr:beta-ketoacyl-ACP synthase [Pseudoalteromonas luteoviolacea]MCF6442205.1 beta-ketoacyl-ACP synthase [Pseudoalteromonas luteoviolacea]